MSGLFDRLMVDQCTRREASRRESASHKFAAIKRHLETLLNARQGCSQSSPELGLRDFNGHDVSNGDLLVQVSADIRRTLQRFEPRIQVRTLNAVPDTHAPLELHFRLDCLVQVNNHAEQLQLELLVDGHKPDVPPSPSHYVTVRKIEGLPIVQCSDIRNRALNLRTLGESTTFTLESWPFRHTSQFVNAWIDGVESGNVTREIRLPIATALPVPSETGVMVLGSVTKTELLRLAINYQFRVSVEVSFDDKLSWLKFPDAAAQLEDKP